jgi:transcriptional repressor NrdR
MKCPYCDSGEIKVVDKRPTEEGKSIRRRRECVSCEKRFSTYERIEDSPVYILKKDGRKETFCPVKLKNGIVRAFEKRPVTMETIDNMVDELHRKVRNHKISEVPSKALGKWALTKIKKTDKIAYIRFASVHKDIEDLQALEEEIQKII